MILHVFKHEMRLIFRDPRFWIPFVIPPIILAASQFIAVNRYGGEIFKGSEGYMMLLLGCLMAPMGSPLAADSFAGERERNSLELLQLSPIKPFELFWGKFLAILPFPIIFSMIAQGGYWLTHSEINIPTAFASILGALSSTLLTTAFTLQLSLRAKTVRSATHLSLFMVIPTLLAVQIGHEIYFSHLIIPIVTFVVSLAICTTTSIIGLKHFTKM